jgi:hypothetical protein
MNTKQLRARSQNICLLHNSMKDSKIFLGKIRVRVGYALNIGSSIRNIRVTEIRVTEIKLH